MTRTQLLGAIALVLAVGSFFITGPLLQIAVILLALALLL